MGTDWAGGGGGFGDVDVAAVTAFPDDDLVASINDVFLDVLE